MIDLKLDHYIYFKKHIGVDGLLITGLPGTGKSQIGNYISGLCLKERKENFVVPFDVQCEFLNLKPYAKETIMILPEDVEFHYHNCDDIKYNTKKNVLRVNYDDLNIEKYLKRKEQTLVAIYDNHYRGNQLFERTNLWVKIAQQLLDRTYLLDNAVGLLFHEAGIYFPQVPIDKHWKSVKDFSELFVDFRKRLLRGIFISQRDKEINVNVRGKCMWHVYRKGYVSKEGNPKPIYKSTPFLALNQYHFMFGGLYTMDNVIGKLPEHNHNKRVIPITPMTEQQEPNNGTSMRDIYIKKLYNEIGWTQEYIADFVDLSQQHVSRIVKQ
jgi:hypothetical protein